MTISSLENLNREELLSESIRLLERVQWLEKQMFGQKSEKSIYSNPDQTELDLGVENNTVDKIETQTIAAHERRITGKALSDIPDNLPVLSEETIYPEVDLARCDKIGEETTRRLERVPAKIGWHVIHRPKLKDRENGEIFIAELPAHCNPKGLAGNSILSSIYIDKFQHHIPLYRQSQQIKQECGVTFSESTLCDMVRTSDFWLNAMSKRIEEIILKENYLQVDESRIPVLRKGKHGKTHTGYEWVLYSPRLKAAVFRYEEGRAQIYAEKILKNFHGKLQTDDYCGYNNLRMREDITAVSCMAHARRKFVDAKDDPDACRNVLEYFAHLYAVEDEARDKNLSHSERDALRKEKSVHVMNVLHEFMMKLLETHSPASGTAKAIGYTIDNWQRLKVYLDDGEVEIDNNNVENKIRPLALGRKNWMFAGSENGARWASTAYTIIATAKLHNLDPKKYVELLLEKLPSMKSSGIDALLPWNIAR
jgi:transposase